MSSIAAARPGRARRCAAGLEHRDLREHGACTWSPFERRGVAGVMQRYSTARASAKHGSATPGRPTAQVAARLLRGDMYSGRGPWPGAVAAVIACEGRLRTSPKSMSFAASTRRRRGRCSPASRRGGSSSARVRGAEPLGDAGSRAAASGRARASAGATSSRA
jgi:hypothetical protein